MSLISRPLASVIHFSPYFWFNTPHDVLPPNPTHPEISLPTKAWGARQRSQNTLGTSQGANLNDGEQTLKRHEFKASVTPFPAMVRFIVGKNAVNIKKAAQTKKTSYDIFSLFGYEKSKDAKHTHTHTHTHTKTGCLKDMFVWWSQKVFDLKDVYHQSQVVMINYPRLFWFHHPAFLFKGGLKKKLRGYQFLGTVPFIGTSYPP